MISTTHIRSPQTRRAVYWQESVERARWMLTGTGTITLLAATASVTITLLLLISGLLIFNRVQRNFVDTI